MEIALIMITFSSGCFGLWPRLGLSSLLFWNVQVGLVQKILHGFQGCRRSHQKNGPSTREFPSTLLALNVPCLIPIEINYTFLVFFVISVKRRWSINIKLGRISNSTQNNSEFDWKCRIRISNSRSNFIFKFEFDQIRQSNLCLGWSKNLILVKFDLYCLKKKPFLT